MVGRSVPGNLIDNAVRHNVANGTVTVAVTSASGRPVLTAVNTGRLVPEAALEHLFEPFRTTSADRSRHSDGHGLGLAIVRAIADAHDAAIETNARPTGGLEVSITFPRC